MKKHRTSAQWQALVDQQQASGLSAVQFCKQHDVGYATQVRHFQRKFANLYT